MVDQEISQHRAAEGSDERCHHRVSQGRAPLSQNRKCERFWTLPLRVRPPGQSCRPDPRQPAAPGSAPEVRPARGLENGLVRFDRQRVNISFERYYLRSAVDTRFVASGGWWAPFRTETAYWPRFLSGSTFGTTTVRWKASQFSRDS